MHHKRTVSLLLTAFAVLLLATILFTNSGLAAGEGPAEALLITGEPYTTEPNTETWFKFGDTGQNFVVTATLDANGQSNILFRVYTPDSIGRWLSQEGLHPVGVSANSPEHDQVWEGRFQQAGTYYLVVHNSSDHPIEYVLNVTGNGVTTQLNPLPTLTPVPNPFGTPVPQGLLGSGKIVFQSSSGGQIYTVNANGTNLRPLTAGLDPALSPNGSKIAFVRQGPVPGLFVMNADGTNEENLFGGVEVRSPAWASENEIVFSTIDKVITKAPICILGRCVGDETTRWTLFVYDLRDESITNVPSPSTGGLVPTVNRVLGKIAFLNPGSGLMLTEINGKPPFPIIASDPSINTPSMAPDGARLTYMANRSQASQVIVSVWDGTNPTQLTHPDPLAVRPVNNVAPTFSPDGREILFLSDRNGKWEFFVMNNAGTNLRQVLKSVTDVVNIEYNYNSERVVSWSR